jgi:hypothetical protein
MSRTVASGLDCAAITHPLDVCPAIGESAFNDLGNRLLQQNLPCAPISCFVAHVRLLVECGNDEQLRQKAPWPQLAI